MMNQNHSVSLKTLLKSCVAVLCAVEKGQSLQEVMPTVTHRAGVQAIVYHTLRHYYVCQQIAQHLLKKKPPHPQFQAVLTLALSLLLPTEQPQAPQYTAFTVVNQAVQLVHPSFKGLLNAVLRRFLREQDSLLATVLAHDLSAQYNFPLWWIERLQQDYPTQWTTILQSAQTIAPIYLRVNRRQTTTDALLQRLHQQAIEAQAVGTWTIQLQQSYPVDQLPGYDQGWFSVQDLGAQQAVPLLPLHDGQKVLDACAAPGGKTAHILELAQVDLTAVDISAKRLQRVQENLHRLRLPAIQCHAADVSDVSQWWDGQPFDCILADVPCTASGIVRRHPDIRLLRQADDVAQTVQLQRRIVPALLSTLKVGGYLLYSTCSVFQAEGPQQVQWLLSHYPLRLVQPPKQLLPAEHDGFFYAVLEKMAE